VLSPGLFLVRITVSKRYMPPFGMKGMLRLERGPASVAETLRRYAPLADEIGADGMDVDAERADLLVSGSLV
jgi:hypothetical protein